VAVVRRSQNTLDRAQLFDYEQNFVRTQLEPVRGHRSRSVRRHRARHQRRLNPEALQSRGLSPYAVRMQSARISSCERRRKIGARDYNRHAQQQSDAISELNDLP